MLQSKLATVEATEPAASLDDSSAGFLRELSSAWRNGEVRATHRKRMAQRHWRTRPDAFESVWPQLLIWLDERPDIAAKDLFVRLQQEVPDTFADGQLRTLQRRVKQWRQEMARRLIFGSDTDVPTNAELATAVAV